MLRTPVMTCPCAWWDVGSLHLPQGLGLRYLTHIAVVQANVGATGGEAMYDQRLFNRDQGMGQGLANDEGYNLYDKALFADRGSNLFKPSAATADDDDVPEGAHQPRTPFPVCARRPGLLVNTRHRPNTVAPVPCAL